MNPFEPFDKHPTNVTAFHAAKILSDGDDTCDKDEFLRFLTDEILVVPPSGDGSNRADYESSGDGELEVLVHLFHLVSGVTVELYVLEGTNQGLIIAKSLQPANFQSLHDLFPIHKLHHSALSFSHP